MYSHVLGSQHNTRAESDNYIVERTARVRWIAARRSAVYSGEGLVTQDAVRSCHGRNGHERYLWRTKHPRGS